MQIDSYIVVDLSPISGGFRIANSFAPAATFEVPPSYTGSHSWEVIKPCRLQLIMTFIPPSIHLPTQCFSKTTPQRPIYSGSTSSNCAGK